MAQKVGTITVIHRCLIKSVGGVDVPTAELGWTGMRGDREIVVWDVERQVVITAKQREGEPLLGCSAWRDDKGDFFTLPGSDSRMPLNAATEDVLSDLLKRKIWLVRPHQEQRSLPTNVRDFELRTGVGVDSSPVHFITTSSLAAVGLSLEEGVRRLRPTFVIETVPELSAFTEDDWEGQLMTVGKVRLLVRKRTERCAEPARAHGSLPADLDLLHKFRRGSQAKTFFGMYATVVDPGAIQIGDEVSLQV